MERRVGGQISSGFLDAWLEDASQAQASFATRPDFESFITSVDLSPQVAKVADKGRFASFHSLPTE
jgi:hypothetical protein